MTLSSLFIAIGAMMLLGVLYCGARMHLTDNRKRKQRIQRARLRNASGFRLHPSSSPSNPYGTWRDNLNEVRRRRRNTPRASPHLYSFRFTLPI